MRRKTPFIQSDVRHSQRKTCTCVQAERGECGLGKKLESGILELVVKTNQLLKDEASLGEGCHSLLLKGVRVVQPKLTWQCWLLRPSQPSFMGSLFCSNGGWKGILMKKNPKLVLKRARRNVAGISFGPSPPHVFHVLFSNYAVRDGN